MAADPITQPALSVAQLHLWRGDRHLLKGVSFTMSPGELLQVMGPNGVGKTSLLRCVAGLLPVESGEVRWGTESIWRESERYHEQLAYLAHTNALKADLTAAENLKFGAGVRRAVTPKEVDNALARLQVMHCRDLPVRALSAGQKRRVALARVTLVAASLWILDEPITNLDKAGIATVEECMADHLNAGGMILTAAHQTLLQGRAGVRTLELQ